MTSAVRVLRLAIAGAFLGTACHTPGAPASGDDGATLLASAVVPDAPNAASLALGGDRVTSRLPVDPWPRVQLTWRLFETRRWLDGKGQERQSSIFELLVEGGAPSHVQLGRRESSGCVVRDPAGSTSVLAALDCYAHDHGEHADVERPRPGELRVEAFGQDVAYPDDSRPRTNVQAVIIRVPAESDIVVDAELATVPADAPPGDPGRTSL